MIRTSTYGILLRSTLLCAGLAAGLAASTLQAAEPKAHSATMGVAMTDTSITAKVKAKLMAEDGLKKSDISVTTTNGVVALHGSASSSDAKALAGTTAHSIDGVKSVDNDLATPGMAKISHKTKHAFVKTERVMSDSWITTKVKSSILADSMSKGFDVNVKTMHGVVELTGALGNQNAIDHVVNIARKVKGVKSVNASGLSVSHT